MTTALIDMDGTLFDHDGALRRDLLSIANPDERKYLEKILDFHALENQGEHWKNRIDMIRRQPGWWLKLQRLQLGTNVLHMLEEIGYCCKILTKGPRRNPQAWAEKAQCIYDHFGDKMNIDIVGRDKGGTYGRILMDDYPKYIEDWLEHRKRGLVIMPVHAYNRHFTHPNVVPYNGTNNEEVRAALQAAYDRKPTQHWKELLTNQSQVG